MILLLKFYCVSATQHKFVYLNARLARRKKKDIKTIIYDISHVIHKTCKSVVNQKCKLFLNKSDLKIK